MNYFIFFLGMFTSFAGVQYIEVPCNNLFIGVLILYAGLFMVLTGTIRLAQKGA